jgi:hypothetical protein
VPEAGPLITDVTNLVVDTTALYNAMLAIYDQFDDRYLGSKAADPALDNDGNALLEGALYWNSTSKMLKVYDGANWQNVPSINSVTKTSNTGSAVMPAGTTGQRDGVPAFGYTRANSTLNRMEWWNGTLWAAMGGGATGGGANAVFHENDQNVTVDYTITAGKNAMSAGPITINAGITVTIPAGSVWTII